MSLIVGPDSSREKKKPLTSRTHDPSPILPLLSRIDREREFISIPVHFFAAIGSSLKRYKKERERGWQSVTRRK